MDYPVVVALVSSDYGTISLLTVAMSRHTTWPLVRVQDLEIRDEASGRPAMC